MTALPQTSVLRLDRRGARLYVTIDDPATRNAMTEALVGDLEAVLAATQDDRSLSALILQGANGAFCAGADLKNVAEPSGPADDAAGKGAGWLANRRGGRLFKRLNEHPIAVVAVIDGAAIGGGFGLTCCADVVICTGRARFALSETSLGLAPAQIAPYVVARIGLPAARRLALTASRFDGRAALAMGLADYLVDSADDLETTLTTVLNDIGRCAPGANAITKALLLECASRVPPDYADRAADAFAACVDGPEGREGVAAFVQKRPANWVEKV